MEEEGQIHIENQVSCPSHAGCYFQRLLSTFRRDLVRTNPACLLLFAFLRAVCVKYRYEGCKEGIVQGIVMPVLGCGFLTT